MSIPPIGLENPNIVEWRTRKSGFFDHHTRDAGMLCDERAGEHLAALDTVISRTLACCHFERSVA